MDRAIQEQGQSFMDRGIASASAGFGQRLASAEAYAGGINMTDMMENTKKHMIENSILDPIAQPFLLKAVSSKTAKALGRGAKKVLKGAVSTMKENASEYMDVGKSEFGAFKAGSQDVLNSLKSSKFGRGVMKVGQAVKEMNPEVIEQAQADISKAGGDIFQAGKNIGQRFVDGDHTMPSYDEVANHIRKTGGGTFGEEEGIEMSDVSDITRDLGVGIRADAIRAPPTRNPTFQIGDGEAGDINYASPADLSVDTGVPTQAFGEGDFISDRFIGDARSGPFGKVEPQFSGARQAQDPASRSARNLPEADGQPQGEAPAQRQIADAPDDGVEAELQTSGAGDGDFTSTSTSTALEPIGEGSSSSAIGADAGEEGAMTLFGDMSAIDVADQGLDAIPGLDVLSIGGDLATAAIGLGLLAGGQVINKLFDPDKQEDMSKAAKAVINPIRNVVSFASQFGTEN